MFSHPLTPIRSPAMASTTPSTTTSTTLASTSYPASERTPIAQKFKWRRKHDEHSGRMHDEGHKGHGDVVRDVIIGFADGLTVPFALTAGLSSYLSPPPPLLFPFPLPPTKPFSSASILSSLSSLTFTMEANRNQKVSAPPN